MKIRILLGAGVTLLLATGNAWALGKDAREAIAIYRKSWPHQCTLFKLQSELKEIEKTRDQKRINKLRAQIVVEQRKMDPLLARFASLAQKVKDPKERAVIEKEAVYKETCK